MGRKEQLLRKLGDDELLELTKIATQTPVPDGTSRKDLLKIVKSSFSINEMKGKIWQAGNSRKNRRMKAVNRFHSKRTLLVSVATITIVASLFMGWLATTTPSPQAAWSRTYGGGYNDYACSVQQTSDGGYIVAGYTWSFGAGYSDFWLVKTDGGGNQQWNKTYGGANDDEAYSVQQTRDGGCIVAGCTNSFSAGGYDFWLVKTSGNGKTEERTAMIITVGAVAAAACIILGAWWDDKRRGM